MKMKITFLGAAGTVTGSKYLITAGDTNILVDCGLFQGQKELRELNWKSFPIPPKDIDFILLTHGHLDHVGYLPLLVSQGFQGPVYGTAPTLEICEIVLSDSARIQEEDAERANRKGFTRHSPAKPLYTVEDVDRTIPLFIPQFPGHWVKYTEAISFRFRYAGHILGASFIELKIGEKLLVFSGDTGREVDPLLFAPEKPEKADILFLESTYGNKLHPKDSEGELINLIQMASGKGGTILLPCFAVERSQAILFLLTKLRLENKIPEIPVYFDSPMGKEALAVFKNHRSWHRMSVQDLEKMDQNVRMVRKVNETYKLAASKQPKIIIAGSGMANGGRILSYFANMIGDAKNTIIFTGFQAEGTRGRKLIDGEKSIRLYGKDFKVKAAVHQLNSYSSHADQEGLLDWVSDIKASPEKIFIVHGEPDASKALKEKLAEKYNWDAHLPFLNETVTI